MALEKLKSIFAQGAPKPVQSSNVTELTGNSDFSPNFDITAQFNQSDLTTLSTTLNDPSADIRFTAGLGFPPSNIILQTAFEGAQASAFYINVPTGDVLGISGAINKLGPITDTLNNIGIETPNIPFSAQLLTPPPFLKYQDTVFEMFNTNTPTNSDAATTLKDQYRGLAFQVLGDNTYNVPFRYEDIDMSDLANLVDTKLGYQPLGTGDPGFALGQQIQYSPKNQLSYDFLDPVVNEGSLLISNPITDFNSGNIKFKNIDLNINFDVPDITKNVREFLDKNIRIQNPFRGLRPGESLEDLAEIISENELIQNLGKSIGGIYDNLVGFGKQIPTPDINLPFIDINGLQNTLGGVGSAVGGALTSIGGALGSAVSGLGSSLQGAAQLAQQLNPIEEFTLPSFGLKNPFNQTTTDYGGQAVFNNSTTLRSADITLKANKPADLIQMFSKRVVGTNDANVNVTTNDLRDKDDRFIEENGVSTTYANIGKSPKYGLSSPGQLFVTPTTDHYPNKSIDQTAGGDRMTLAGMFKGTSLSNAGYNKGGNPLEIESSDNGYPFYFKDHRDDTYIIFRAYIDGLTENINPNWSPESYIGRSEPVFNFSGGTERNISFNLTLAAQTALELDAIYAKLRRLTSLCYPEYKGDTQLLNQFVTETQRIDQQEQTILMPKVRMKPPLCSMRIGELYGNNNGNLMGFIKSLTYTFDQKTPWETRSGQRVPKYVTAAIDFQVIHKQVPNKNTLFYGFNATSTV